MREGISRSRQNRILGGVAGGLANYLSIDIIVVRILFVISMFFSGIGILLYIIMWIVIPEEEFSNFSHAENINTSETTSDQNVNTSEAKSDPNFNTSETTSNPNINFTIPKKKNKNVQLIFGIILILFGVFFLGIEVFSFLNFEDLFPILLVGLGIYLLWNSKNKRGSNEI